MKEELLYGRYDTENMTIEELKTVIWRYFMGYWNNRRICSTNGGLPPAKKRRRYKLEHQNAGSLTGGRTAARALELLRRYAPQQFQSASWSAEAYLLLTFEQKVSTEIDNFKIGLL